MAANEKNRRMSPRGKIDPQVQQRLRDVTGELRRLMYGQKGCPEWGTLFREIEADGMSVGLELARLLMEQTTAEQAEYSRRGMSPGSNLAVIEKGRKAFFPS